jgi:hypothetical protein
MRLVKARISLGVRLELAPTGLYPWEPIEAREGAVGASGVARAPEVARGAPSSRAPPRARAHPAPPPERREGSPVAALSLIALRVSGARRP